jgi:hypothetical protein
LVPDPTKFILLLGAVVCAVALVGFIDLELRKNAALDANRRALAQMAQMRDQQRQLTRALEEARQGQDIAPLAYRYFGRSLPGVTVILPEQEDAGESQGESPAAPPERARPGWGQFWEQFMRSLTNGVKGLQ